MIHIKNLLIEQLLCNVSIGRQFFYKLRLFFIKYLKILIQQNFGICFPAHSYA